MTLQHIFKGNTAQAHRAKRYMRYVRWRRTHLDDSGYLLVLSVIIGIMAGAAASLLKLAIAWISSGAHSLVAATGHSGLMILVPLAGVIATVVVCRYIVRDQVSNGVARIVTSLNDKKVKLNGRVITGSMLGSALTLGCGGTAGSEGPIAYAGAGLASKLGQWLHVSPKMLMVMVGAGAGAGIAGIFKAPIGGALFTFEILRIPLSTIAVIGVFAAALAAGLTAYILSGYTLDISVVDPGVFDNSHLAWMVALGIICGLYSLYYTWTGELVKKFLDTRRRQWVSWLASGLALGLMVYFFPAMYGEGYGVISNALNFHTAGIADTPLWLLYDKISGEWLVLIMCSGILLLKGAGSSAANNGGGVAGDFAPTLFAGCILGVGVSLLINLMGWDSVNTAQFGMIAMAGAMSGIIRAPLMAMFLVTEMVGGLTFLLPVAIVSIISYSLVMICKHDTFYHSRHLTGQSLRAQSTTGK